MVEDALYLVALFAIRVGSDPRRPILPWVQILIPHPPSSSYSSFSKVDKNLKSHKLIFE